MLASSLAHNATCRLEALSISGLLDAIGSFTDEELVGNRTGPVHRRWPGFRHNPVFFSFLLHPSRHPLGVANQTAIFGTDEGSEMADVQQ